jgi:hypothetical protein
MYACRNGFKRGLARLCTWRWRAIRVRLVALDVRHVEMRGKWKCLMKMLVLCSAYARRPVCFGGGCQDVHAAVAMSKETQAHFQGWSRAMSRTRDQPKAEICLSRELENALFCYDEQIARAASFFLSQFAAGFLLASEHSCAKPVHQLQNRHIKVAYNHKLRRTSSVEWRLRSRQCARWISDSNGCINTH